MPRRIRPRQDRPDPVDPHWQRYFVEREEYIDLLFPPRPRPEPEYLVEGLLPRGYVMLLAGRPKDGKTCLALALAHAVSKGEPFAGLATRQADVLYFCCEESPMEFEIALAPHLPPEENSSLRIAFHPILVDRDYDLEALHLFVNRRKIGLVVIDPLLAATVQPDFGSPGRARSALDGLKALCRETGCAAIVVHHAKERRHRAYRAAENPQLAATASLNAVLNWHRHPKGRVVTLALTGRGDFANRTLRLLSEGPCLYSPLSPSGGEGEGRLSSLTERSVAAGCTRACVGEADPRPWMKPR